MKVSHGSLCIADSTLERASETIRFKSFGEFIAFIEFITGHCWTLVCQALCFGGAVNQYLTQFM